MWHLQLYLYWNILAPCEWDVLDIRSVLCKHGWVSVRVGHSLITVVKLGAGPVKKCLVEILSLEEGPGPFISDKILAIWISWAQFNPLIRVAERTGVALYSGAMQCLVVSFLRKHHSQYCKCL